MVTIPKSIKVGGLNYSVEIVKDIDDGCVGKILYKDQKIKILEAQSDFMVLTFIHEVLHAMNAEVNEIHTEFLAQALCQFIKDNPAVFAGETKWKKKAKS